MKDLDYTAMGKRIRNSREAKGKTQEQIAEKIQISPTFLSSIENGVKKGSFNTYMKLAIALDVTLDYLSQDIVPKAGINEQDKELLDIFHSLEANQRQFVLDMIRNINKSL